MKSTGTVYTLGPLLDEYTLNAINKGKQLTEAEQNKKILMTENKYINNQGIMVESTLDKMNEIKSILKKAGINLRYFPFNPVKNRNGEIEGFVPKGENLKEIKKDVDEYKEKIQEAFDKGIEFKWALSNPKWIPCLSEVHESCRLLSYTVRP